MSLPTIMRLDRVAVGTAHLAFGNLHHFAPYIPALNGGALRRKVETD